jgi:tRNA threonylcarbamoyl adenosine modification protein YeaZ
MRILGVDTATSIASAALIENGRIVVDEISPQGQKKQGVPSLSFGGNHAEVVLPLIDSVLRKAGVAIADLSALAVSVGPGSFTGVRIGLSTIKGLSYGASVPVLGFSTLLANAGRVENFNGLICSFLDARKNQVYAALFRRKGDELGRISDDRLTEPKTVIAQVTEHDPALPCFFIGDGTRAYGDLLLESLGNRVSLSNGDGLPSIASAIARLGETEYCRPNNHTRTTLSPVYLRLPEAEEKQKRTLSD